MSDPQIQVGVSVSSEGAERALDNLADKAGQMATSMQRDGEKAGAAVDGIGAKAVKSADQFSTAEGRIAASIKRATTNLENLGKTASQKLEFQIASKGLDASKFEPLLTKLRELESANVRVGMSAAQTAAALRNVPAQMTDIVTSLASGQQPMTVLLQQGGQLKDVFGGVGNAARAVGGYVAGMINPLTIAAAAVGGLGYAFYSARSEADEFQKNLILSGSTAGLSVDKFNTMAAALDNLSGVTRGAAAEALTAMAASGNIGAGSIERLTAAALKLESAGGPAIADTVKQFEELGKKPTEASLKLNEQTRYLTVAVYEQIKALEEQGRASEAGALAQKAWADAIEQRTPQMIENLGYLETGWRNLKFVVAEAWDAMKGIGRDATFDEKFRDLQIKIADARDGIAAGSINSNRLKQQKAQWERELAEMVKSIGDTAAKASVAAKEQARVSATAAADRLIESQRSKREKLADELRLLDAQRAKELISEEKYQQAKAALAKKYEEKPKAAKADKVENAYQSILDSLNKQLGSAEKLNAVEKLNVELQEKKYAKLNPAQKESLLLIAQQIDMQKQAEVEGKATLQWIADGADAQKKAVKSLNDELSKATREVATYGMSRSQIAEYDLRLIDEQIAAEKALNDEIGVGSSEVLRSLELQRSKRQEILEQASKLDQLDAGKKAAEKAAKSALDAQRKAAEAAAQEWQKTVDRIYQTFHDGFVGMLEKGKADWESFADSIANTFKTAVADEIYKMTIRPMVVQVVGAFSGQSGVAGQAQGIGGVISNVQSAYSGVTGGISNAANSFATSGMGQWAGLSTTYGAGYTMGPPTAAGAYGYTAGGTALTNSGSSFVASAAPYAAAIAALAYGDHLMKAGWGLDNNRKGYAASAAGAVAGGVAAGASAGASAGSSVGPVGTVVGAVVGAIAVPVLDRLFGHNNKTNADAAGIQGSFDLSGFSGEQWQQFSKKGGTFRSDKRWTDTYDVSSDIDKELDSAFRKTVAKLQDMGKTLGVETSKSIEGFTHEFSLQLSDNGDMSKAGEKLAGEITRAADELVSRMVPNVDEFARLGETASQTFTRLNQEVAATDAILLAMGKNAAEAFGGVGLASIAAREDLIDLAGGLEQLANKTQSFYANFYSSEEQVQLAAKQAQKVLTEGFAEIGQSIPATREAFRALVESQDLSTEAGRKLWNSLLDLQDEFDAVADGADATAASLSAATTTAQQGQASLFDTFASDGQRLAAAQKLVSDTFASIGTAVPENAAAFLSLAQSIDPATEAGQGFVAAMAKVSNAFAFVEKASADSSAAMIASAQAAAQAIAQASQSRRSVQDQFDPAGSAARAQADINAAFAKYGATNLIPTTREGVAQLAGTIDVNSSLGQEQMAALQSLSGAFDTVFGAQERAAQEAAAAAQASISAAKSAADEQMRLANQVHDSISGALRSLLGQSEQFETQSRQMAQATLQSALVIAKAGGSLSNFHGLDAALASVSKLDKATFATAAGYAVEFGRTANLLTQLEQYTRINGSHANGLDYVPFDGYVAQLHRGERVQTAASAAAADATVEEVKALRQDLNAIGAALATYTQKTAKLMAKFDVEGIPARV